MFFVKSGSWFAELDRIGGRVYPIMQRFLRSIWLDGLNRKLADHVSASSVCHPNTPFCIVAAHVIGDFDVMKIVPIEAISLQCLLLLGSFQYAVRVVETRHRPHPFSAACETTKWTRSPITVCSKHSFISLRKTLFDDLHRCQLGRHPAHDLRFRGLIAVR
jgi:hypothetical protein